MIEHANPMSSLAKLALVGLLVGGSACSKPEEPPAASPATEPEAVEPEEVKPEEVKPAEPAARPADPDLAVKEVVGLATPESVLYDAESDRYLVSNIDGNPIAVDGNGFISRISPDGTIEALKWIDGTAEGVTLNAPKGMAISGGTLYVSDITAVRKFDLKTGKPTGEIAIKGTTFLNDIAAAPDGTLYVTDSGVKPGANGFEGTGTDAVYKITGGKAQALAKGKELGWPNGLLLDGSDLWIASLGSKELYKLVDGKKSDVVSLPEGSLDGIVKTNDGKIIVSSWDGAKLFGGTPGGEFTAIFSEAAAPADIGYDTKRNLVLIPRFSDNKMQIVPLAPPGVAREAAPERPEAADDEEAPAAAPAAEEIEDDETE